MYQLVTVCGSKKRFNSMSELFQFLEGEAYNRHPSNVLRLVGESFVSTTMIFQRGFQDVRNIAVSLHDQSSLLKANRISTDGGARFCTHHLNDGEKCTWLATKNKYIVSDWRGEVVPVEEIASRYNQRFEELHKKNSRYGGWVPRESGVNSGYKWDKGRESRLRALYKERSFVGAEMKVVTSQDEFDMAHPLRKKRERAVIKLAEWNDYGNHRDCIRNWKSQSKKRKQWM